MQNFDNYEKYEKMSETEFRLKVSELEVKLSEIGLSLIKCDKARDNLAFVIGKGYSTVDRWIRGIAWGLVFFSIGAFFSTISWLFAYISQTYYNEANGNDKMIKNGTIWRNTTIITVVVSGIAFLIGGFLIFYVITSY